MTSPKLTLTTNDKIASNGFIPTESPTLKFVMPPVQWQEAFKQEDKVIEEKKSNRTMNPKDINLSTEWKVLEKKPLKIAIVGTAPSSNTLAPYDDPSWEIWVCSPGNMNVARRVTRWFEIHGNLLWPEHIHYGAPYVEWLKKQSFPIYMQDQSYVSNAITFPKNELVKEFGKYFFTSSFAWMIAFAIKAGATEIALFGVDMASKDEYILQRTGGHFFINECLRRGIKISTPHESDLMQPPGLYGYSDVTPMGRKIHARELEIKQRASQLEQQARNTENNLWYMKGAQEDIEYFKNIWISAQEDAEHYKFLYAEAQKEIEILKSQVSSLKIPDFTEDTKEI